MKASEVFQQIITTLQNANFQVRVSLQEVLPRVGKEVMLEVDSVRMEPAETDAYEWTLMVRVTCYEDNHLQALDTMQRIMYALDKGSYSGVSKWQIESATVNPTGSYFEVEVMFSITWYSEVVG